MVSTWQSWRAFETPSYQERDDVPPPALEIDPWRMENGMPTPKVLYELKCGHLILGPAYYGANGLDCNQCDARMELLDIHVHEWHAKCLSCSFGKWTGLSKDMATYYAHKHSQSSRDHKVGVEYVRNPDAVKFRERLVENNVI